MEWRDGAIWGWTSGALGADRAVAAAVTRAGAGGKWLSRNRRSGLRAFGARGCESSSGGDRPRGKFHDAVYAERDAVEITGEAARRRRYNCSLLEELPA